MRKREIKEFLKRFKVTKILLLSFIFLNVVSYKASANVIYDCTNKVYNMAYQKLSAYEKQQVNLYTVYIVEDKLKNILKCDDNVMGQINYKNKTIYVSNNLDYGSKSDKILYHEIGHSIDNNYSNSQEFLYIYEEEKNKIYPYSDEEYFLSDPSEYFAECTAIYHIDKEALVRFAPRTYGFLNRMINQQIV